MSERKPEEGASSRRGFFKALLGGTAALAALGGLKGTKKAEASGSRWGGHGASRYRLTADIRKYYESLLK
ncbi:MAG: hypothetical protein ACE5JJ_04040 [Nitrospinota bacterium]